MSSRRLNLIRVALLALVFCGHVLSTNQIHTDSAWYIPSATSVLREGDTDLDEYERLIASGDYKIEIIRGHLYTIFPVGPVLISLPFVWAMDSIAGLLGIDIHQVLLTGGLDTALIEEVIASFLVAACALVLFETARAAGQPYWVGAVGALVFAFGHVGLVHSQPGAVATWAIHADVGAGRLFAGEGETQPTPGRLGGAAPGGRLHHPAHECDPTGAAQHLCALGASPAIRALCWAGTGSVASVRYLQSLDLSCLALVVLRPRTTGHAKRGLAGIYRSAHCESGKSRPRIAVLQPGLFVRVDWI